MTPSQPFLSFDLRFHSLFEVEVPMKELSAAGDDLEVLLRVTPASAPGDSVYFSQDFPVPELGKSIGGRVHLDGGFVTGEGRFRVQMMMRHQGGRICSFRWEADAVLNLRDPGMKLAVPAGHIEAYDGRVFHAEAPVVRMRAGEALKVKVIANFTPQQGSVAGVSALDAALIGVVSILRNIAREPRVARFSVVAFDMNEQRVIFRQTDADQIDFPALGRSVVPLKPGVVQYRQLADPGSGTAFLSHFIEEELACDDADAVVFAGPKLMLDERHPIRSLNLRTESPVFYLNYNLAPFEIPWRDAIGKVVKQLRGAEYTISCPRDIWMSWADVMKRIGEQKRAGRPDSSGCGDCSDR